MSAFAAARILQAALADGGVSALLCDRGVAHAGAPVWTVWLGGPFAGPARTVAVPDGDLGAVRQAAEQLERGEVLVIAAGGHPAALWGDRLTSVAHGRGAAGIIVDGYIRDVVAIAESGLPVRARGTFPMRGAATGRGRLDRPVDLAGAPLAPGDLVVNDADGVVVVPADRIDDVERHAQAWLREERGLDMEGTER